MPENLEILKSWPGSVYLKCGNPIPDYAKIDHRYQFLSFSFNNEFGANIEYIRADLVKIKTEEEIKGIICRMLQYDNIKNVEGVYLANAIFDALKNAGLHCK